MGFDPFGKKKQKKLLKDLERRIYPVLGEQEEVQRFSLGQQEREARRGLTDAVAAYDEAKKELAGGTRTAHQDIQAAGKQATGGALQGLVSSGNFSPNAVTAASRGISADMMRATARVDTEQGARYASLAISRQETIREARSIISAVHRQRAAVSADQAQSYINFVTMIAQGKMAIGNTTIGDVIGVGKGLADIATSWIPFAGASD